MSLLKVTSSPHLRGNASTRRIMADVLIALSPCMLASVILFGFRSLIILALSTALCVLLEYICRRVMKRQNTVSDLSAAVTGVLFALTLPPDILPTVKQLAAMEANGRILSIVTFFSIIIVGSITAIVVVKQMFGGLGNNFVNPALTARIVTMVSFPGAMSSFRDWGFHDAVTSATPLSADCTADVGFFDLFLGNTAGTLGETCKLAILIGFLYLVLRRVIFPLIPVCYVGTVAVMTLVCGGDLLTAVLGGGLLFGAVFMATDYVTTPITPLGKILFAVGCGVITALIRMFANMDEGVSYAIVLMNILVPLIDRITRTRPFGKRKKGEKA